MLSIAVQHHPARAELLPPLLAQLPDAEVITDPDPHATVWSAWRTYKIALDRTPADATHRLIVQDDAQLCRNFLPAIHRLIEARPASIICLFVAGRPVGSSRRLRRAAQEGLRWIQMNPQDWVPVVATIYPAVHVAELADWPDRKHRTRPPLRETHRKSDDFIVGLYARENRVPVWATVPSLVQHPDVVPSLVGRRPRAGADRGRVATLYIGDADPLEIDWTA